MAGVTALIDGAVGEESYKGTYVIAGLPPGPAGSSGEILFLARASLGVTCALGE